LVSAEDTLDSVEEITDLAEEIPDSVEEILAGKPSRSRYR
jgi:hypothetical protein